MIYLKKEFIVERQGKSFVLYAGLLDLAHQQGLTQIRTELVQTPIAENYQVAICLATVVMGEGGSAKSFTGIGDAAPENVSPAMRSCLIRMAETRAKARALRDAVNVGVAAFEELGDDEVHETTNRAYEAPSAHPRFGAPKVRPSTAPFSERQDSTPKPTVLCSESQRSAILKICSSRGFSLDTELDSRSLGSLDSISSEQAAELIKSLSAREKK